MDSWERFNETLPDKEAFYSSLNMENIADVDYRHAKRVFNGVALNGIPFNKVALKKMIIMICMFKVIYYCWLMYLRILQTNLLKYMN